MLTLLQLIIRDFGGSTAKIGTATAAMAASEVPVMFMMAFFYKKIGFKKLLALCGIIYVVRMIFTYFAGSINSLIYIQLLQGLSYAVLIPISMSYLSRILDERIRSTAITIYAAVTASLTGILGNLITSAFLSMGYSVKNALIVFILASLLGFLLTMFGWVRKIWDIKEE
jgi:MFS family permease